MEHLVGGTLEARLAKGALPLDKTLEYAIQIADALDKAHRQGVVHRDLKPGNIMLVKSGAKLLDFGLAKLQAAETPTNLSALPTEQANLTAEGTILGTLQYMAPEQLEAKEADFRTDIFAFGAVVYEMATGKKAFEGKSQASLIAAILKDDPPPMSELQRMTPQLLDWVVKRCLAKEPDERWQTAADLMAGLRQATEMETPADSVPAVAAPAAWKRVIPWSIAIAAVVIASSIAFWRSPQPRSPSTRFAITPSLTALADTQGNDLAISADGRNVLYKANTDRGIQLYLHSLDDLVDRPIPGTEGLDNLGSPFFSPDGKSVAFFEGGKLKKVSLAGGSPITLCEAPGPGNHGSWGSDDTIVFSGTGLHRVSAAGGEPEILATPDQDKGETWYKHPLILPGGKTVLFSISGAEDQLATLSLETGEQKILIEDSRHGIYVETGHLIYEQAETGNLMAVSLDLARLEVTSDPVPVFQGIRQRGQAVDYALSDEGTLVYVPSESYLQSLVWVDRKGTESVITQKPVRLASPRVSPDGTQIALVIATEEANQNIWIYDLESESLRRLTFEDSSSVETWSPDGQWIIFQFQNAEGQRAISRQLADGSGAVEHLMVPSVGAKLPGSLTPDGSLLAFDRGGDIFMLPMQGDDTEPQPFITSPNTSETNTKFSPDGKWLAYVSDELGLNQVYVSPFPNPDEVKWLVSEEGGGQPVWSPDGTELFYRNGNRMMVVSVRKDPAFRAGRPEVLFEGTYLSSAYVSGYQYYDISPDGQFLMIKAEEQVTQIHVILNWFEELKRLAPTGN
jgi:Tol biopolymer transport system component